mmetsp:Transcript_17165/g.44178  ORF Transcript_17165/g.44178 Transcript_17165/m.44178 type:complete len:366 (-) Transcript_17165:24-1121(-)
MSFMMRESGPCALPLPPTLKPRQEPGASPPSVGVVAPETRPLGQDCSTLLCCSASPLYISPPGVLASVELKRGVDMPGPMGGTGGVHGGCARSPQSWPGAVIGRNAESFRGIAAAAATEAAMRPEVASIASACAAAPRCASCMAPGACRRRRACSASCGPTPTSTPPRMWGRPPESEPRGESRRGDSRGVRVERRGVGGALKRPGTMRNACGGLAFGAMVRGPKPSPIIAAAAVVAGWASWGACSVRSFASRILPSPPPWDLLLRRSIGDRSEGVVHERLRVPSAAPPTVPSAAAGVTGAGPSVPAAAGAAPGLRTFTRRRPMPCMLLWSSVSAATVAEAHARRVFPGATQPARELLCGQRSQRG